jgi:hypothetical protein
MLAGGNLTYAEHIILSADSFSKTRCLIIATIAE